MVFSRTRATVLLVALVVAVLALGIVGVLRAVSAASPGNAAKNPTAAKARSTLTTLVKSSEATVVDLVAQGPTPGDLRVVNAPLHNESGTKRIGRVDVFCITTDPANEPNEKAHMAECTATHTLPGGEISVQGTTGYPKLSAHPPRAVDAITGGTGKYAGVRGEVRIETRGNKVFTTYHFIG